MLQRTVNSVCHSIEERSERAPEGPARKPYSVSSHVKVRALYESVVLLDLRANEYLMLPPTESAALAGLVNNWPVSAVSRQGPTDVERNFSRELYIAGILTTEPVETGETRDDTQLACEYLASEDEIERHQTITIHHVVNFVYACVKAAVAVRFGSLQTLAQWVASNRSRAAVANNVAGSEAILEVVDVFSRLRPFVFTAKKRCLFHSLALLAFLSRYRIVPEWVIGVKISPWGAHSWLVSGNKVLDSTPEKICEYTPIFRA